MSRTYRVGLVGCGGMGRNLLDVLKGMRGFDTAALADVAPEALIQSGETYGVAEEYQYADFEDMYERSDLDLVVVATQTRQHCAPTVAALKRGISV
ncbi:Gfo/Idh/MocA family protein, partial [Candidatus Latescibacterota bacterium]